MRKYILIIAAALSLTSCKKWLDVNPQTSISREDLFSTEEGFEEALIGVYTKCTSNDLYGGELSFGLPDALAQNFTYVSDNLRYLKTSQYNFKDADYLSKSSKVWNSLYNAIMNANLILLSIDEQKGLFTGNNYAMIKGEALALRAYLHFDAFRLFGNSTIGTTKKGVPYVTTYSTTATPVSSPDDLFKKLLDDLNTAKGLLKNADSITSKTYVVGYPGDAKQTETKALSLFQRDRRHRLNYYAVCAELARVYLYKGDKENALANVNEVLNSKKFALEVNGGALTVVTPSLKDRILYKELVFGWYLPQLSTTPKVMFEQGSLSLTMSEAFAASIYETAGIGGEDVRFKEWLLTDNTKLVGITKYKREAAKDKNDTLANLHPLMAPGIRLSELYYIAAECSYATSPAQAGSYLEAVRKSRSLNRAADISSEDKFYNELLKEARKEWIGEGQIFYMYKRLNRSIPGQSGLVVSPAAEKWVLPYPSDEIEFGGR